MKKKENKMRKYPTKFGQYYSTSGEKEPATPWLLLADGVTPCQPKATAGEGA